MKRKSAEVARKSMSKRTEIVDATPIDTRSSEIEEVGPVCEAVDARADADDDADEDDDEEDEGEEEEEEEEEDESVLPRILFNFSYGMLYADCKYVPHSDLDKAMNSLEKCRAVLLQLNEDCMKIFKASKSRKNDGKVPPGSNKVQRSLSDDRFLLCLCTIEISKIQERRGQYTEAVGSFREALLWYPRSIQAIFRLASLLRTFASSEPHFVEAEALFRKAFLLSQQLKTGQEHVVESEFDDEKLNAASIKEDELKAGASALELVALMLCQRGQLVDAEHLLKQGGFKWRLGQGVLSYSTSPDPIPEATAAATTTAQEPLPAYTATDNALKSSEISHLRHVFRPTGPYWSEHDYDSIASNASRRVGYFSYVYPFTSRAPQCSIEVIIDSIFKIAARQFPRLNSDATIAEWWVHSRPHCSGHQLHFDSDETHIEDGGQPCHPLCTCIIFVTAAVGGPTLITNQLLSGDLATQGLLFHGKPNRMVAFEPKYLHGVIPGKGFSPDPNERRLSFMVGFWDKMYARNRGQDSPGPGQPFPDRATTSYSWPAEMVVPEAGFEADATPPVAVGEVLPTYVAPIWEPFASIASPSSLESRLKLKPQYQECFQGF